MISPSKLADILLTEHEEDIAKFVIELLQELDMQAKPDQAMKIP